MVFSPQPDEHMHFCALQRLNISAPVVLLNRRQIALHNVGVCRYFDQGGAEMHPDQLQHPGESPSCALATGNRTRI